MQQFLRLHWAAAVNPSGTAAIEKARHVGVIKLREQLNLSPSQEQTVMKILDDYGKFYQNIEDEREDVANEGRRQILRVLSPEQQKQFNKIIGPIRR